MADPCKQDGRLKYLEGEFGDMMREIRDNQKMQTQYLIDIARQSTRLDGIEVTQTRHEKAIGNLYERTREYDKIPGAMATKVLMGLSSLIGGILSGIIVWMATHG